MKNRRFLEVLAISSTFAAFGCAGDVKTIDRTQPNALDKSMFEGIWYERATVTSASPESGETEGINSHTEKMRWEITEELLIGYRSYEIIPYAEGLTDEGRDFFGAPVVAYPIVSHFDIQRDYNTTTGVENNVIVENTTDRPWYERRYMRVDWTRNVVGGRKIFSYGFGNYPTAILKGYPTTYVQSNDEDNPDRPYITPSYFDFTNVYEVEPDEYYCAMQEWYNFIARCGTGEVKVRQSFLKIDASNDYQSLYYPDVVELRDDAGNALILNGDGRRCDNFRDPGECQVQTYPYDAQFGNFRIEREAFDRERYLTRSGRIYAAGRFDIWEHTYNTDGSTIPYDQRKAKPVIYYGNVNFPEDMIENAQFLTDSWNVPFLETVASLQGVTDSTGRPDVAAVRRKLGFDMYQFRQNDCNVENVKAYAQKNGLEDVVARIAGNIDRVARGNLDKVCAAVQFAELAKGKTLDAANPDERAFQWQRTGDLRFSFQNYVDPVNYYGPWGVAQFGQDPETGEFISNTANYFGVAGDYVSQSEVDVIQWLNGDLSEEELFRGDFTRNTVVSRRTAANNNVRDVVRQALQTETDRVVKESGDALFAETTPDADNKRMERMFKGTALEREVLVNDELLRTFAGPTLYQPYNSVGDQIATAGSLGDLLSTVPGDITDEAIAKASPVSWGTSSESNFYMKMVEDMGSRAYEMADFFDPNTSGLADSFKGESRDKIYQFLRKELYAAVEAHEVGHTLGLRHNFEGSMDALNYHPDFWYKENQDGTVTQYWNNQSKPGNANRGNEYKYSTIMDYGFDTPLEGLHGIGSYDRAAIRFFYGQLVDVWDPQQVSLPDPRRYGSWARRCGYNDDFLGAPALIYWLGPASIPSIFSQAPVLEEDGSQCVPYGAKVDKANHECSDDPNTAIDEGASVVNYDSDNRCDSQMDKTYRDLVTRMEATSQRNGLLSECGIWYNIEDVNKVFDDVNALYPDTSDEEGRQKAIDAVKRIYGARKAVPVETLITQKVQATLDAPEYDVPGTVDDESRNCKDDDGDGQVDDKGYDWSKYLYAVQYGYCSDFYAGFSNPRCQRWDTGWNFTEATDNHIMRYDRDYVFDHFRRDRSPPWGSGRGYIARLESRRFFHMTNVYRYYLYTRRTAFEAPLFKDWAAAAYKGLNFLERVLQTPEPGRYCLNSTTNVYELDITGEAATCDQPFSIGLGYGEGKFLNTAWTNEYYYKPNRIGSFYDKLAAIRQLTASSGIFVRDVADLFDRRAFSLGYMRVFEDPLIQRFAALIENDHTGYQSAVATDENGGKYVRYMPFFDEEFNYGSCTKATERTACTIPGTTCNAAPNQTGVCVGGSVRQSLEPLPKIQPAWSWSLQFLSLAYSLGNFSSINDYAPEFFRFTKIAVKGTPEDIDYGPAIRIIEFTDPETRIVYRAPDIKAVPPPGFVLPFPSYYGDPFHRSHGQAREWGIGADLLKKASAFVTNEWEPKHALCPDLSVNSADCRSFEKARKSLNDFVGYIDLVRKFNKAAEFN